ncbi:septin-7 [Hetaerina americana]|uniref:septin-7 n=1 Tax=Hetaerina americana TaxID=62018 RepID=UPI003A7F4BFF
MSTAAGTPSSEVHVANGSAPRPGDSAPAPAPAGARWGDDGIGRRASPRTAPPPTPPKYAGIGSGYRLSSLDRLAQRQRLFEAEVPRPPTVPTPPTVPNLPQQPPPPTSVSVTTSSTATPQSVTAALQSKRELFFKNEIQSPSTQGSIVPPPIPATNGTVSAPSKPSPNPAVGSTGPPPAPPAAASSIREGSRQVQQSSTEGKTIAGERQQQRAAATGGNGPVVAHKELDGYVGFANLPNQVYRKAVKKGFDFTLMVVGESGLGKSTLINSMFLADIYSPEYPGPSHRIKKTVQVETTRVLLRENGVNLTLTVVDTPGFGDAVDNSNCWQPVIDYVESKYEEYLNAESRVGRRPGWGGSGGAGVDGRVHCCLYFVAPSGHGLKPLDAEFMRRLHDRVNVVPVIAKADTLTPEECSHFKKQIISEIAQHKIKIYEFPSGSDTGDEDDANEKKLRERVPFAVVGSNAVVELEGGKKVRGRRYPWGIAEVENLEHCDFVALRDMLIRTHLQDLKDVTNNVHYENYRCRKLAGLGNDGKPTRVSNRNPLAQMEEEKREHEVKMKKMESEMEQVFEMKVREKKQKLRDSEADLQRRHEAMRKALEVQQQELDERRKQFEKEKASWESANGVTLDELRRRSLEANSKEAVDGKEKKNKKKGLF